MCLDWTRTWEGGREGGVSPIPIMYVRGEGVSSSRLGYYFGYSLWIHTLDTCMDTHSGYSLWILTWLMVASCCTTVPSRSFLLASSELIEESKLSRNSIYAQTKSHTVHLSAVQPTGDLVKYSHMGEGSPSTNGIRTYLA